MFYPVNCHESVCSPTVRIIAFQAIDPGSTPGKRNFLDLFLDTFLLLLLSFRNYHGQGSSFFF